MDGSFHFLRKGGFTPGQMVVALLVVSVLCRFYLSAHLTLLPDEAYYYLWSQHLDLSYFSKGPAIAYTIAVGTALLGHHELGVRFFSVLLSAGTAWQLFLLARHWFDDKTGLVAVLFASIVPLYSVGAVLMTIDPLSAFFWLWGANFFSRALATNQAGSWLWTGFAVGCGFLAKFLNGLELLAFLLFLLLVPARRGLLLRPGFWLMLGMAILCTLPVWWWNAEHGWPTMHHLIHRGDLQERFLLHPPLFLNFLVIQAAAVSPLLFLGLMILAALICGKMISRQASEAEIFLFLLFAVIFVFYAGLAWHTAEEPNWPAISYFSLILLLAHRAQLWLNHRRGRVAMMALFLGGWLEILLMHGTAFLPLPGRFDPMSRVAGWREIALHLEHVREDERAEILLTDAYKEASILSFYLPDHRFIFTKKGTTPDNQFYFWPGYSTQPTALYITYNHDVSSLAAQYREITPVDEITIFYRGTKLRDYTIYRCENP